MNALPPDTDISKIPLIPNPNGDPPNFLNPPNNMDVTLAVGLTLAIISTCFVSLRLTSNFKIAHKLGLDDYLCIFAQVMSTVYLGLILSLRDTSRHEYDIPLSFSTDSYVKRQFALNFIVGLTRWSSKATILALYIRIFGILQWLRYTCYVALATLFLFYSAQSLLAAIYCAPRRGDPWDFAVLQKCSTLTVMGVVSAAVGLATDIVIMSVPLPILRGLNMPTRKKVGLCIIFLMGIFAVAASTVTVYFGFEEYVGVDQFWNSTYIWACVIAENYVTIMVSCAPAMSSFWANILTKSAFYSSLRSRFLFSPSTCLVNTKEPSQFGLQMQLPHPGSSSKLVHDTNGNYELFDGACSKPYTKILSSRRRFSGDSGTISKWTVIDQFSEREE